MYKTINENISSEIVEKKSKFIANIFYIQTVEDAENKLEENIMMQGIIVMLLV